MARAERVALIEQIQEKRGKRLLISYVTSTRPGFEVSMADDVLRLIYEHLNSASELASKGVDLFIHSNGGSGTVPWRIVNLIRSYCANFAVIVPHHAFSAATLTALGADEIVMHRMGCLGPIDPSVTNHFNPENPSVPGQFLPISVEDVSAYIKLIKDEIGITHEDQLIDAVVALTERIHPLALGNVQRSHSQSRMIARKLLKTHVKQSADHDISQLIENLKSNLFFHGHPINRREAKDDLKLEISTPEPALEKLIWDLYEHYEKEMRIREPLNAIHEIEVAAAAAGAAGGPPAAPGPITTAQILAQIQQLAAAGLGLGGGVPTATLVDLAAAMVPHVTGTATAPNISQAVLDGMPGAYVESKCRTDVFRTDLTFEKSTINSPSGPQEAIRQKVRWQRWEQEL